MLPIMGKDNPHFGIDPSTSIYRTTGFESVDRYKNSSDLVAYLEIVNALPDMQRYKERLYELLALESTELVLDVGCGTGSDIREIIHRQYGVRIVGIDTSEAMLQKARILTTPDLLESGAITYARQDINYLGFTNNSFDAVRADRVFQHLSTPQKAIHEIMQVTKPGGRIILADSCWDTLHIDGIPYKDSETMRKTYLTIVKNPSVARSLQTLMISEGMQDITAEIMELTFPGFRSAEAVLWMEDSLQEAAKMGGITNEEMSHATQSIKGSSPKDIAARFDFYLVRGIKPLQFRRN